MNSQRCNASAAVLNDKIYIAGASNGYDSFNSVEVYDPDTNRWTYVAPMHSERAGHSCIVFRGSLYVLGGHNRTSCQLSTEKYDPAEDTWTEIRDMNVPGTNFNAEVIDDTLFFIGGCYDGVEIYNDEKKKWFVSWFVSSGLYNHKLLLSKSTRM
ncbi:kelch-like protein 10 [Zootermopsis nevadensis]|nr:kelch-like protein 10 [Zootermopsis nevadensis]